MERIKLSGIVVKGRRIGRTLGFPTANLDGDLDAGLEVGVYAARVRLDDGSTYEGMANLGYRPSVGGKDGGKVLEVNLFGYEGSLYGQRIEVELLEFIRPEKKFATLEDLKKAVDDDRETIEKYFKS